MGPFGGKFHDYFSGSWQQAKGYLRSELEQLRNQLKIQWGVVFGKDNTLQPAAITGGSGTNVPLYVGMEVAGGPLALVKVNVRTGVQDRLQFSNLVQATIGTVLLGRDPSGAGDFEQITLGAGLVMAGTVLSISGVSGAYAPASNGAEPPSIIDNGAGEFVMVPFTP